MAGQEISYIGVDPIVLTKDKKIILVQRGPDAGAEVGKWHIPGALVKASETLEEALKRAVREKASIEIGLLLQPLNRSLVKVYDDVGREPRYRDVAVSFLCQVTGGSPVPGHRMKEVRAFAPEDIDKLDIGFDHKRIVLDGVERLKELGYI